MRYQQTAAYVKGFRKNLGLTQKELATSIGMHPQFISNIERGLAAVPPKTVKKLVRRYDMNIMEYVKHFMEDKATQMVKRFKL